MSFYNGINTLTGDCSNNGSGGFTVYIPESTTFPAPFVISWNSPISGATFSSETTSNSIYAVTGLTAGTYSFNINSLFNGSSENYTLVVTSSITVNLLSGISTTCGSNNGLLQVENDSLSYATYNLYNQDGFVNSAYTTNGLFNFTNLGPGYYYVNAIDYGGCQGNSNTMFVGDSTQLDFGFYIVDSPACMVDNGQIYVTGITGTPPFTYNWGQDTSITGGTTTQTGLTAGSYVLEITDTFGCTATKYAEVGVSPLLSVVTYSVVSPTCLTNNGSITMIISGGSAPYYYLLSNGDSQILLSNQVTFTGLSSGNYVLNVTDAGLCTTSLKFPLSPIQVFNSISTSVVDQSCATLGSINVSLQGGTPPYNLKVSSSANTYNQTLFNTSTSFNGLSANSYLLTINDASSSCTYTQTLVVNNNTHYDIISSSTGATCGNSNGIMRVDISNQYETGLTWTYRLSNGVTSVATDQTFYIFTGLSSGFHTATVVDNSGCTKQISSYISFTSPYNIFLFPTGCLEGNAGTITAMILESDGPFNLSWSDNVNGQTGYYVSGLTAGTYYLTVSGGTNCTTTRSTTISCSPKSTTSYSFKYSSGDRVLTPSSRINLKNMMYQGYSEIASSGDTCTLSSCTFYVKVNIGGTDYQFPFYNTNTFENIPEFSEFTTVLENAILTIPHIESCTIDPTKNSINIVAEANSTTEYYKGESVEFTVILDFVLKCRSINSIPC